MALQKEIWEEGIKENPVPDTSFLNASIDKSEYVENNKLHLAEAGVRPNVEEDYFKKNTGGLPVMDVQDIPNEVVLKTYSTHQTRHRNLEEIELQYDKRTSVINRHKESLALNLGQKAAFAWTPSASDTYNKILSVTGNDSVIDSIIDMQQFYADHDKVQGLNICLSPEHMARIRKEDAKLHKDILSEKGALLYGFNIYSYSKNPLYTSGGAKKPFGTVKDPTDRRCSFTWATDEVFRSFGDVVMYSVLQDAAYQADTLSFAKRALVGSIRATNPRYLGAII